MRAFTGKLPARIAYKASLMDRLRELPLALPIGVSSASYEVLRLSGGFCHLLVGGQTGSGKSVFLRQLISGIHASREPDEVRFYLDDLNDIVDERGQRMLKTPYTNILLVMLLLSLMQY